MKAHRFSFPLGTDATVASFFNMHKTTNHHRKALERMLNKSHFISDSMSLITWMAHAEPNHPKHSSWRHPLAVLIVHYISVFSVTFAAHLLVDQSDLYYTTADDIPWNVVGFVSVYSIWLLAWRLFFCEPTVFRSSILYEYCWLCNVTLVLGAASLALQKPAIAAACCITVGIDQLLWYVDLLVYFTSGKFPIGVAGYIVWENTSWSTRITCTHHLWTIPIFLYAIRALPTVSLPLSAVIMVINVTLSRFMTPAAIEVVDPKSCDKKKPKLLEKYLNVNLSHALWKDIKISCLQINYGEPPALVYLWRLLWRWEGFNIIVFGLLRLICYFVF